MRSGILAFAVAFAVSATGGLSCSTSPASSVDASVLEPIPAPRRDSGAYVHVWPDAGGPGAKCDPGVPVPIWVDTVDGVPSRIHVPVVVEGKRGVLLFDTGSETTFITTASGTMDPLPDGGTLSIGSCSRQATGRPFVAESSRGFPGLGFLGTEELFAAPRSSIDLTNGTFTRIFDLSPPTDGWLVTSMEIIRGSMLVRMRLDDIPVRLLVDTGSADILWLHRFAQPGDVETQTTDAEGTVIRLFAGTVAAEITAGIVELLPVVRAPSFPYFEQRVRDLGGDVHGLLGMSALGGRHVVFDTVQKTMYRQPK